MARRIDRAVGLMLLCALGFAAFWAFTGSIPWAAAMTFALGVLLHLYAQRLEQALGKRNGSLRMRQKQARKLVAAWSLTPDAAAAQAFLRDRYQEARPFHFSLLARYPSGRALDVHELLAHWRAYQGESQLVLAVTGGVEPTALALAQTLRDPAVRLIPGDALADILARASLPLPVPPEPPRGKRVRLARFVPGKKRAPLCALYALFMLLAYFVVGVSAYLVAALILLALAAAGLKRASAPETLFD